MNGLTRGERTTEIAIKIMGGSALTIAAFTIFITAYLVFNGDVYFAAERFDPYPFNFMTLCLSLFANYQAMFVLLANSYSIKRAKIQEEQNRMMIEAIYAMQEDQLSLSKALKTIAETQSLMLDEIRALVLGVAKETEETGDHVEAVLERVTADTLNVME